MLQSITDSAQSLNTSNQICHKPHILRWNGGKCDFKTILNRVKRAYTETVVTEATQQTSIYSPKDLKVVSNPVVASVL